tara:strand:- start:6379 stop:6906 length:528 start_codon:yes stop_codon:yes gene_type:complete
MANITHRHSIERPIFSAAAKGENFAIVHGATLAVNWARSDVFSLGRASALGLEISYNVAAAGQQVEMGVVVSNAKDQPAADADIWYFLSVLDASPTDAVLTGTVPTGADWSVAPEFGKVKVRGSILQSIASDTTSDKIRLAVAFEMQPWRWCHVVYRELGGGTAGSLSVAAALSS